MMVLLDGVNSYTRALFKTKYLIWVLLEDVEPIWSIYIPWARPNLQFLEGFMINNLVFRWPKPWVLGAHGLIAII